MKQKYKVHLNWYGEIHKLYTSSSSKSMALSNAICQLAKRVGYNRSFVKLKFLGETDNYKVEERKHLTEKENIMN